MSLVGIWVLGEADDRARADLGDVVLEFDEDGNLTYFVRGEETDQIIKLRYQIDGDTIITDQPSAPQTERTAFSLSGDRELTLAFGGVPYSFFRWESGGEGGLGRESKIKGTAPPAG